MFGEIKHSNVPWRKGRWANSKWSTTAMVSWCDPHDINGFWKIVKYLFYFHLISREISFSSHCVRHGTIIKPRTFAARENRLNRTAKSVQRFYSFYETTAKANVYWTCVSLFTSGVAFCCVLAFELLIQIWLKNFHPLVHYKQSKAFLCSI